MKDRVIYQLTEEDLQTVSNDLLDRNLTEQEVSLLEEKIDNYIEWYNIIEDVIRLNIETNADPTTNN